MKKVEVLFTLMKDGSKVPVEKMIKTLGVKQGSIMCLISALRNDFGGDIETERDGRKVLSYQLKNADAVKITSKTKAPKVAKPKAVKTPKVAVTKVKSTVKTSAVPTIDADFDVSEVSDSELADLKNQLGLA